MLNKVRAARIIMRMFPSEPEFDISNPLSEILNHNNFLSLDDRGKEEILFQMAENHYKDNEKKPFDSYFPGYDFRKLFKGKTILDLGCWCGGKTVSYAERWGVKEIYGLDVNQYFIKAAEIFSSGRNNKIPFTFSVGYSESLPYKDNFFDAIVTHDVFEHVKSLKETIEECRRVLKPGGGLYSVFPSYYTIGESHLGSVTRFPVIQWFFGSDTLNEAYKSIIEERGERAYWYYNRKSSKEEWRKFDAGIGINGTTFMSFKKIIRQSGFSDSKIIATPFLSVGSYSLRHPLVRKTAGLFKPIVKLPYLQELLSHRIVSEIVK